MALDCISEDALQSPDWTDWVICFLSLLIQHSQQSIKIPHAFKELLLYLRRAWVTRLHQCTHSKFPYLTTHTCKHAIPSIILPMIVVAAPAVEPPIIQRSIGGQCGLYWSIRWRVPSHATIFRAFSGAIPTHLGRTPAVNEWTYTQHEWYRCVLYLPICLCGCGL